MFDKFKNHPLSPLIVVVVLVLGFTIGYVKVIKTLYKEEPHVVEVGGKKYTRWTEFNGKFWQVFMVPVDSTGR